MTGTMGGVTPVLTVDGRTIGSGRPGPYVAEARRGVRRPDRRRGHVVVWG